MAYTIKMATKITKKQFIKLHNLGIRHFDEIIHDQPKAWLVKNFKEGATKFPINVAKGDVVKILK